MRERPILFNGAMVRAMLAGQKTQTRRAIKPQPIEASFLDAPGQHRPSVDEDGRLRIATSTGVHLLTCPYGQPGDRLWVREAWGIALCGSRVPLSIAEWPDGWPTDRLRYAADGKPLGTAVTRPSVHMPRWACRLVLEITAVRIERLQDISEEGALAGGVDQFAVGMALATGVDCAARALFRELWERAGGDWDSNPWVWVIEFNKINEVSNG